MTDALSLSEPNRVSAPRQRHVGILLLVAISLAITMSLGQLGAVEYRSPRYWAVVAITLLLPLLDIGRILRTFGGRAQLLFLLLLLGGGWHLLMGDVRAAIQLGALIVTLTWIATDRAMLNVADLVRLYLVLIVVGAVIQYATTLNVYSLIPGYSDPVFGRWRVSFFPNIAYTGILSLGMLMVLTKSGEFARANVLVILIATYFLVASFVRAALVAAVIYFALLFWFNRRRLPRRKRMFWLASIVAIGFNVAILFSVGLLYYLQDFQLVSVLLLRGESDLSAYQILYQLYRPWLWVTQYQLFLSSPWLMGWGSADFRQLVSTIYQITDSMLISAGTESLPTRLLVAYGLPGILFTVFLFARLRVLALRDDRWACACFPAIFVLMMNWGSVFHPTDGMFIILMLIVTRGSAGFVEDRRQRLTAPSESNGS